MQIGLNPQAGSFSRAQLLKGLPDTDPRRKILDRLGGNDVQGMLRYADDYSSSGYMSGLGLASGAVSTVALAGVTSGFLTQMMERGLAPALDSVMSMPGMICLLAAGGLALGGMLYERHRESRLAEARQTTIQLANDMSGWNLSGR
ncbi:MAG: hypothetical protein KF760_18940 [Candidatus Eremiobacteraeota bacterium]|nr:hypothetical protein [Candidatus Eremiobacteraeota bacterium]MCW5868476.1 hypothetical protein [Candidatus Eremiobacteraeota bacterium]